MKKERPDKFKSLVLQHAAAMAEHKRLKRAGEAAQYKCTRLVANSMADTCIQHAYKENASDNADCGYGDGYSYDATFQNIEPPACEHCILVRKLKKERGKVGRKLGAIRAAMSVAAKPYLVVDVEAGHNDAGNTRKLDRETLAGE